MSLDPSPRPPTDWWLALFAKTVVAATFVLILIGGHTTTAGAGMAFPDWPLSAGSLNPAGWWENVMQRLEHGHRYMAETVGLMIGALCGWVWRKKWSVPLACGGAAVVGFVCAWLGYSKVFVVHAALWSSVLIFMVVLLGGGESGSGSRSAGVRFLAFAAFIGVCIQAVLGGLRVINDPAGSATGAASTAMIFRVVHGCFAQLELCVLVALAAVLSPTWARLRSGEEQRGLQRLAWLACGVVFVQLIIGATMRHLGAGLAIPTFPRVEGGWWPHAQDVFTQLNFAHTRIGAALVTLLIVVLVWQVLVRGGGEPHVRRPAALLLALLLAQITMGAFVIWKGRPPVLTTLHVVNGAAVLATTVLLAMRAGRRAIVALPDHARSERFQEVSA